MELTVRPVRVEDAEAIVSLLGPIIRAGTYTSIEEPQTVTDQLAFLSALPERGLYLAAIDACTGTLVGIQDVLPSETASVGEISTFVDLAYGRRGIGRRLCDVICPVARDLGYRRLRATIRAGNRAAVAFYVSQGWRVVRARESSHGDTDAAASVVAERLLDDGSPAASGFLRVREVDSRSRGPR